MGSDDGKMYGAWLEGEQPNCGGQNSVSAFEPPRDGKKMVGV